VRSWNPATYLDARKAELVVAREASDALGRQHREADDARVRHRRQENRAPLLGCFSKMQRGLSSPPGPVRSHSGGGQQGLDELSLLLQVGRFSSGAVFRVGASH
jgi:hypothetical protein